MKHYFWETSYCGRKIKVVRETTFATLRSTITAYLNDELIAESVIRPWDQFATLFAAINIDGTHRQLEIRFGTLFINNGAQILVNSKWVGGDRWLNYPDPKENQKQFDLGFLQFFLRIGLVNHGLPFGIGMTIMQLAFVSTELSITQGLASFIFCTGFYGVLMSALEWRGIKSQVSIRRKALKQP